MLYEICRMAYGVFSGVNVTAQFNPNTGARTIRRGRALRHPTLDLKKSNDYAKLYFMPDRRCLLASALDPGVGCEGQRLLRSMGNDLRAHDLRTERRLRIRPIHHGRRTLSDRRKSSKPLPTQASRPQSPGIKTQSIGRRAPCLRWPISTSYSHAG